MQKELKKNFIIILIVLFLWLLFFEVEEILIGLGVILFFYGLIFGFRIFVYNEMHFRIQQIYQFFYLIMELNRKILIDFVILHWYNNFLYLFLLKMTLKGMDEIFNAYNLLFLEKRFQHFYFGFLYEKALVLLELEYKIFSFFIETVYHDVFLEEESLTSIDWDSVENDFDLFFLEHENATEENELI